MAKQTVNNAKELQAILKANSGAFIFYPSAPASFSGKDGYELVKNGKRSQAVKFPITIDI